jgi:hypothetical protein
MTDEQTNLLELAKQGDPKAITVLMNRSLQSRSITVKVVVQDYYLQIMLESTQAKDQQALVSFVIEQIKSLKIASIERVKIYAKLVGEEFPEWNQEIELAGEVRKHQFLTFEENKRKKKLLQTYLAEEVLEQFMNLKARTAIGISYLDLPPVLGIAKLAVQKFELSSDSKVCPYLTELIKKIMLCYELSLECLGLKVKRSSIFSVIGLGFMTGIEANEPLGKFVADEFPNVSKSIIHGLYDCDTVLSLLWTKAGELTDEFYEILNKPVDLETLKLKN